MIGSIYFSNGTITEQIHGTETSKEMVKQQLRINYRGLSNDKQPTTDSIQIVNDFKKQKHLYHIIGDIIATPTTGSTAWQHQKELRTLLDVGGTCNLTVGSDGTFEGTITKYKITHTAPINKFNFIGEFEVGISRT